MSRPLLATAKREKIEIRVTRQQKETLRAAADKLGKSLSAWMLDVALRSARRQKSGAL